LPAKKGLGSIFITSSDFLFNDVNFALTHLSTDQIFHNIRRENLNKLVLDELPEGEYEFLVYAHHCLTNMESGYLSSIAAKYQIDFNLIRWVDE
jgi:hypothetical protein